MSETVDAIVTRPRGLSSAGVHYAHGAVIFGLPAGQYADWGPRGLGWVARAAPSEIEAAKAAAEKEAERRAAAEAKAKAAKSTSKNTKSKAGSKTA